MKKIILSVSFLLSLVVSFAQSKVVRSSGANTVMDTRLGAVKNFLPPQYTDTTQANLSANIGIDSCGAIIFTYDVMSLWTRACSPKRWVRVGSSGSISFENSNSILFSGTGDALTPITADVNISSQQGNAIQSTGEGLYVKNFVQDGIIVPGVITWVSGYTYDVSPATGIVGGIEYTSDWTPITLANSDPTYDRIDLVVFNAGGTISVITGTPSDDPQEPIIDPSTQLKMAFIEVTANTTQPPTPPTQDWIYLNNAEWTTLSSTVRINPASTSNPYSATLDVQGTLAQNGDNIRYTAVAPPTISNFNVLTLKIRSASVWTNNSRIELRWYSGATAIGSVVSIANGAYGFNSADLSAYQIFSVPLTDFGSLSSVTALLMTVRTTGGRTISFYIDDVQLQAGIVPPAGYTASNGLTLVGNDFQLGGTLTKNTTIIATGRNLTIDGTNSFGVLYVKGTTGTALVSEATGTGIGVTSMTVSGVPFNAFKVSASTNTNEETIHLQRATSGTATAGISGSIAMWTELGNGSINRSTSLVSGWTDVGQFTYTSIFKITGVDNSITSDLFTLSGSGATRLNKYGVGSFTAGTPAYGLAVDASGNIIETAVGGGGGFVTADNGLTANTSTNVRLGGTLLQNTTIDASTFTFAMSGTPAGSFTNLFTLTSASTTGSAMYVTSAGTNPTIQAVNTKTTAGGGWALYGQSITGAPLYISRDSSSTNTVIALEAIDRRTSGTAANGIGASLDFATEMSNGTTGFVSTKLVSKLTDVTQATLVSQFEVWGMNGVVSSSIARKFAIAGTGKMTADGYGVGTFTGTAAYTLQVDASGNIIEGSLGGGTYTASNGLTMTANNTKLGGSLIENTTITSGAFNLTVTGSGGLGDETLTVISTGSAHAVSGESNAGIGVQGTSVSSFGGYFSADPTSTTGVVDIIQIRRTTSGTAANSIAGAIRFQLEQTDGLSNPSNRLTSTWTDAVAVSRTSQFTITGVLSAVESTLFTLSGNGALRLNKYGTGAITAGAAAFGLAVDANGNVIEIALGGGGGGTVNSVAGTLNRITSTGGTDPIIDISASYVGQTSITTLGTIATGIWQGTAIGDTYISSAATWNAKQTGDATLTALAALTITNGSIIYGTGADAFSVLAAGTNGQVLTLAGGVPTWSSVGSGTMTTISGVNTNGFSWSIANPTTTPALTLGTSITGILKGNGAAISAAVAGTDYLTPTGSAALLTSFPTFNQNTTGSAATLTTARTINGVSFNGSANITVTAAAGTLTGATLNSTVVSSSLTSVGTISSGTWQGTAVGLGFGGTGLTAGGTANQLLGMNAAGTGLQYKTISATNGATVTHAANSVVVSTVFNPTPQTLTDGATITWNVTNGGNAKVTLAGTGRTLSISNPVAGYTYTVEITQGSGGSKTITTWPSGTTWSGSNTLSTVAGDVDVVVFYYNGTNFRAVLTPDYN